jgi:hypothetical protein
MSSKERTRMVVLEQLKHREISVSDAVRRLGITRRHVFRLKALYRAGGPGAIVHRARDRRPGNRRLDPALRRRVIELYREQYPDFGPTLAAEKMLERNAIEIHPETLRRWLIASGDWGGRQRRRVHRRRRRRRERFGELVQIDGSDHAWFEERGPRSCVMVMIDDATGRMRLFMAPTETTAAALVVLRKWVERWGVPQAMYADCKTLYWSQTALDNPQLRGRRAVHSEFGRVLMGLGIELIPAHSPQAKGRVERRNGVLQDRLVKELRLRGINDIDAANRFFDEYSDHLDRMFGIEPADPNDAHRVFAPADPKRRERAFSIDYERTVAHDNTVSFEGRPWQILEQEGAPRPRSKVTMWRAMDGSTSCQWQNRDLEIAPVDTKAIKAERFRKRCETIWAAHDESDADVAGDQSPGPPGILRLGAKAEAGVLRACGEADTKSKRTSAKNAVKAKPTNEIKIKNGGTRNAIVKAGKNKIVGAKMVVSAATEQGAGRPSASRPRSASASGTVLGSRPRGALSPARSNLSSRKRKAARR